MNAYTTLRTRLDEVIEQTAQAMNAAVMGGQLTSDQVTDKVQHLINLAKKFAEVADSQAPASFTDQEAAPSSATVDVVNLINLSPIERPDVMTVETAPQVGFVKLSFGFVNLLQVALLDVSAKQLYLVGGVMRSLDREDVVKLVYHTKLYQLR